MEKVGLQTAVDLYNAGDKKGAEQQLLQIVEEEPQNADAWYGLALCAQTDQVRQSRLKKCLAADLEHPKARKALAVLEEKRAKTTPVEAPLAPALQTAAEDSKPINLRKERIAVTITRKAVSVHWFYAPILLLLIGFVIWQYLRVNQLEQTVMRMAEEIVSTEKELGSVSREVWSMNSALGSIESELNAVGSLARNANNFAHSHPYSDARLKTDVIEIKDPVERVLQLRGVYYRWDTTVPVAAEFSDGRQIGVIAQEVEAVFPELVFTDSSGYKQVDYERLTAVLIEAIKEQQQEIEQIKNQK